MKAVVCKEFGPPEKLVVEDVGRSPRPAKVRLSSIVRATAITFPDTLIIEDKYQFKQTPPFVLGGESGRSGGCGRGRRRQLRAR